MESCLFITNHYTYEYLKLFFKLALMTISTLRCIQYKYNPPINALQTIHSTPSKMADGRWQSVSQSEEEITIIIKRK